MPSLLLKRIKDWATSITSFRTGDVLPIDGPSGTAKMGKDDLLARTAENALGSIHSLSGTETDGYLAVDNATNGTGKMHTREIFNKITGVSSASFLAFNTGAYISDNVAIGAEVSLTPISSGSFTYCVVDCNPGDLFVLNAAGSTSGRLWAFIDEENKLLAKATSNLTGSDLLITAPENSAKLIVNSSRSGLGGCFKGISTGNLLKKNTELEKISLVKLPITNEMLTSGYYCSSSATAVANASFSITDFIRLDGCFDGLFVRAPACLLDFAKFCFLDKNKNVLSYISGSGTSYGNGYRGFILEQIPAGTEFIRTSFDTEALNKIPDLSIYYLGVGNIKEGLKSIESTVENLISVQDFPSENLWDAGNLLNGYYDVSGVFHQESLYPSCNFVDISEFDYVVCTYGSEFSGPIVYDTWNSSNVLISGTRYNKTSGSEWFVKIPVTGNVKFLTINSKRTYTPSIIGYKNNPLKLSIDGVNKGLRGKKISILGDSTSTYTGYIPPANENYYTGSNCGVTSVDQTWWKRIINYFGLNLLVNNSWSGATISSKRDGYYPGSSGVARCESLDSDGVNPDIIIIYMGTNDFRNDVALGSYDGTQTFPTTWATFRDALAVMLKKVLTKYPLAQTYICSLKQFEHYGEVEGFPDTNGLGLTTDDYTKAILDIATLFGVPVIDLNKCGLNYFNLEEFCGDYSSVTGKGLHPNAAGMKRLADRVVLDLIPDLT